MKNFFNTIINLIFYRQKISMDYWADKYEKNDFDPLFKLKQENESRFSQKGKTSNLIDSESE